MNKRYNLFFAIFLTATLSIQDVYAQKVIVGTAELPLELNLLVEHIQLGNPQNYSRDLEIVTHIDAYARSLSKEDIFLLGKVEVYKTLLKNYSTPIKSPLNGNSVEIIEAGIKKTNDNFIKWFLLALLKDTTDLINNPVYKEFLLQKDSNVKSEKIEYRKVAKKAELIQFWINRISPQSEDFPSGLKFALAPKLLEALKNIQNSYFLMAREVSQVPMTPPVSNPAELKFFKIVERKKPIIIREKSENETNNGSKSVEEILAPLTGVAPNELPKPSLDNWLKEENNPPALQNLPKPNNDADWLQDF
jgi:hypothetical protein